MSWLNFRTPFFHDISAESLYHRCLGSSRIGQLCSRSRQHTSCFVLVFKALFPLLLSHFFDSPFCLLGLTIMHRTTLLQVNHSTLKPSVSFCSSTLLLYYYYILVYYLQPLIAIMDTQLSRWQAGFRQGRSAVNLLSQDM